MIKKLVVLMAIDLFIALPSAYSISNSFSQKKITAVKNELLPLDLSVERIHPDSTQEYFRFYNLDYKNLKHFFGSYPSGKQTIASHIFLPENPKGTIIILHGYFDHTGEIKPLIDLCLRLNYAVATIDLPGHGLSEGDRGAVDNFNEYAMVFDNFLIKYQVALPKPFHLIAHSTGCAAAYEYLSTKKETPLNKIIFLAPLVRSRHWTLTKIGVFIVKPFVKKVPRKFSNNSSDKQYLDFVEKDPLEGRYIPIRWLQALFKWNKKINTYNPISNPTLIIQGDSDNTVAWEFNLAFLKKKFQQIDVKIIEGGKHQLPNESNEITEKVFTYIEAFLSPQN